MATRKVYKTLKNPKKGVKYLSANEAAKEQGVTIVTIYKWCKSGHVKDVYQDATGHWFLPKGFKRPESPDWHWSSKRKTMKNKKKKAAPKKKKKKPTTKKKKKVTTKKKKTIPKKK